MSLPSRGFLRGGRRAPSGLVPALAAGVLLAGCAAKPPPGTLPAPSNQASPETPAAGEPSGRWTVQLHAGEDSVVAEEVASRARERFDEPVSFVDAAGEYHVGIGEFAHEEDARAFARVARERGFPDASVRPLAAAPEPAPAAP